MDLLSRLTELDKNILRKSWSVVSRDKEALATDIFQMIFEQAPDAKLMFSFMLKEKKDDLSKPSSEFTFHALRFIQIIESTVTFLETPEKVDPLLLNLGKLHARHEEQLGFRSHYWSVFKECTLFHFRKSIRADKRLNKRTMDSREIDSAIILWREVLTFIVDRMNQGLEANGLIRKANKDLLAEQRDRDENGSPYGSLSSGWSGATEKSITQISHMLRRTELSAIVPEYFLRRRSDGSIHDEVFS
ncbi:unnamed protein product, partial [Mesorhabditis belari]|uniref:Globin family profile domain-containing protein n=1 Tax=Mesorhabditis belari TaxID=2138241 RepID=A0AAF3J6W3_9BILA